MKTSLQNAQWNPFVKAPIFYPKQTNTKSNLEGKCCETCYLSPNLEKLCHSFEELNAAIYTDVLTHLPSFGGDLRYVDSLKGIKFKQGIHLFFNAIENEVKQLKRQFKEAELSRNPLLKMELEQKALEMAWDIRLLLDSLKFSDLVNQAVLLANGEIVFGDFEKNVSLIIGGNGDSSFREGESKLHERLVKILSVYKYKYK